MLSGIVVPTTCNITVQKMKFSIKDSLSKCDQIRRKWRIWSHVLKKSLILCAVYAWVIISVLRDPIFSTWKLESRKPKKHRCEEITKSKRTTVVSVYAINSWNILRERYHEKNIFCVSANTFIKTLLVLLKS